MPFLLEVTGLFSFRPQRYPASSLNLNGCVHKRSFTFQKCTNFWKKMKNMFIKFLIRISFITRQEAHVLIDLVSSQEKEHGDVSCWLQGLLQGALHYRVTSKSRVCLHKIPLDVPRPWKPGSVSKKLVNVTTENGYFQGWLSSIKIMIFCG